MLSPTAVFPCHFIGVIENLTEYRPEVSHDLASQGLLKWLLQRIKQKTFDSNKLYASEILAILLQEKDETRALLGDLEGIDLLLQQLNVCDRLSFSICHNCINVGRPGSETLHFEAQGMNRIINPYSKQKLTY